VKVADHGPHSEEIDGHGGAKGLFEFRSEIDPSFVGALVEGISKCDLLIVVSWQQADLVSGKVGRETEFSLGSGP